MNRYIEQLPYNEQRELEQLIYWKLKAEGLWGMELKYAYQDALDSRLSDIQDLLK